MILRDPKGINFSLLGKKNKSLVESLISLFNHALIRSNRGTSYTWHLVRLQEEKKRGPALVPPEEEASTSGSDKRQHKQTEQQEVWVGRGGIGASQAPYPQCTCFHWQTRLDIHTHCILVWIILHSCFILTSFHNPRWCYTSCSCSPPQGLCLMLHPYHYVCIGEQHLCPHEHFGSASVLILIHSHAWKHLSPDHSHTVGRLRLHSPSHMPVSSCIIVKWV